MKKIISILLVICISVCFSGCRLTESPKTSAKNILEGIKNYDAAVMEKYTVNKLLPATENTEEVKTITSKMNYELGEETKDGDNASVNVKITTIDMSAVMSEYMSYVFSNMTADLSEKALTDKLIELIAVSDKTSAFDIKMNLVKSEDIWVLSEDNADLTNAVTGGLGDIANSLGSALSGE